MSETNRAFWKGVVAGTIMTTCPAAWDACWPLAVALYVVAAALMFPHFGE